MADLLFVFHRFSGVAAGILSMSDHQDPSSNPTHPAGRHPAPRNAKPPKPPTTPTRWPPPRPNSPSCAPKGQADRPVPARPGRSAEHPPPRRRGSRQGPQVRGRGLRRQPAAGARQPRSRPRASRTRRRAAARRRRTPRCASSRRRSSATRSSRSTPPPAPVRSAPAPGDQRRAGGRARSRTRSSAVLQKGYPSPTACCGRRWSPSAARADARSSRSARFTLESHLGYPHVQHNLDFSPGERTWQRSSASTSAPPTRASPIMEGNTTQGDREQRRRAHDAFDRRLPGRRRDPRRRLGQAPGGHQPQEHALRGQAPDRPQVRRKGSAEGHRPDALQDRRGRQRRRLGRGARQEARAAADLAPRSCAR